MLVFLKSNFFFSFLINWHKWASINLWSQWRRKNTEGRTTNDGYNKKQAQHNIDTTRSGLHAFSWSVHPIPNQLLTSISSYWRSNTLNTQLPVDGGPTCSIFKFRDQSETRNFIYKEKWETEAPKQCWLCIWLFRVTLEEGSSSNSMEQSFFIFVLRY